MEKRNGEARDEAATNSTLKLDPLKYTLFIEQREGPEIVRSLEPIVHAWLMPMLRSLVMLRLKN